MYGLYDLLLPAMIVVILILGIGFVIATLYVRSRSHGDEQRPLFWQNEAVKPFSSLE